MLLCCSEHSKLALGTPACVRVWLQTIYIRIQKAFPQLEYSVWICPGKLKTYSSRYTKRLITRLPSRSATQFETAANASWWYLLGIQLLKTSCEPPPRHSGGSMPDEGRYFPISPLSTRSWLHRSLLLNKQVLPIIYLAPWGRKLGAIPNLPFWPEAFSNRSLDLLLLVFLKFLCISILPSVSSLQRIGG